MILCYPKKCISSQYLYDALGRKKSESLPDGMTRQYNYNKGGGLEKILVSSEDGVLSNVEVLKDAQFDAYGRKQKIVLGNDVQINYTYDSQTQKLSQIKSSRNISGSNRTYQDLRYSYDAVGNLIHYVDDAQQPTSPNPRVLQGLNVSSHSEFTYDALYQLTSAKGRVHQALVQHDYVDRRGTFSVPPNWTKGTRHITLNNSAAVERYTRTYEYDESGNMTKQVHIGTSSNWTKAYWVSPISNRRLPNLDINGVVISNPENNFDSCGNNIKLSHLRAIEWNYRNNISKVVVIDRSSIGKPNDEEFYIYGADGQRLKKVTQRLTNVANETIEVTEVLYLDGCEIRKVFRSGTEVLDRRTSKIRDGKLDFLTIHSWVVDTLGRETNDISQKKLHYQLRNHIGSSSMELDEQGNLITYEEYFPYGGTSFIAGRSVREINLKAYRYSGKERDDATGFYYFGYRYYAHWIGGWLSADPIGPVDSVNLYLYVYNNPVMYKDPFGLNGEEEDGISTTDGPTQSTGVTLQPEHRDLYGTRSVEARDILTQEYAEALRGAMGAGRFRWHTEQNHWTWSPWDLTPVEDNEVDEFLEDVERMIEDAFEPVSPESEIEEEGSAATDESSTTGAGDTGESPDADGETSGQEEGESQEGQEGATGDDPSSTTPGNEGGTTPGGDGDRDNPTLVPGRGTSSHGARAVSDNPTGFTLEVPDNFDPDKVRMYEERIRTDRGVGNRSAVPGERLSRRGSDTTDVIRRDNNHLRDTWLDDQAELGNHRPAGNHVDHGVELQHIIRGDETGGADTVRYEDHRFQPGGDNMSQGSRAMHTRRRAVAHGAPEDAPAGGVARTSEMDLFRNSERFRTIARRTGHVVTVGGAGLSWVGVATIDDWRVQTAAGTSALVETAGVAAYYYGRYGQNGVNGFARGLNTMATGSRLMRVGGGTGMIITSAYSGYQHFQQGEYGVLVGDAAGVGLGGMTLFPAASSTPAVAITGTAMAANYAGDYVESVVTPRYGRGAGIAAGTAAGLGIGAAVGGTLVALGLVSNPVGWAILAVGGIAGLVGALW